MAFKNNSLFRLEGQISVVTNDLAGIFRSSNHVTLKTALTDKACSIRYSRLNQRSNKSFWTLFMKMIIIYLLCIFPGWSRFCCSQTSHDDVTVFCPGQVTPERKIRIILKVHDGNNIVARDWEREWVRGSWCVGSLLYPKIWLCTGYKWLSGWVYHIDKHLTLYQHTGTTDPHPGWRFSKSLPISG